ncbi:MAG: cytochrome c [Gammaproteobacteria bacterium]|nr:cytochrome c [Gammaproteobacteria bacterium]MCP4414269.1 cytochrome c [Gammaproteobacteria bacterium]
MKTILLALSLLLSFGLTQSLLAEDAGEALYKAKTCWSCHGKDAKSPLLPIYPKLAGQSEAYAFNQMKDIKSGKRANGQSVAMKGVMGLVSEEEMKAIAKWLATQ